MIWSLPAKSDLRSIHDFIGHDSRFYAKKVVHDIREKTNVLEQLPRAGRKGSGNQRRYNPRAVSLLIPDYLPDQGRASFRVNRRT